MNAIISLILFALSIYVWVIGYKRASANSVIYINQGYEKDIAKANSEGKAHDVAILKRSQELFNAR